MDNLDQLEQQSVYILRETFRHFERLCMLWSIGKDSTVLLRLARKAFFGHVPFPLVHIDTSYKEGPRNDSILGVIANGAKQSISEVIRRVAELLKKHRITEL